MATLPLILTNGTTADADEVMAIFYPLYNDIDNSNIAADAEIEVSKLEDMAEGEIIVGTTSDRAAVVTMSGDATIDENGVVTVSGAIGGAYVPVGTILAFYDFNALVTFSSSIFAYCNGATIADASSPINGQTLPDLSGRYLVGFGSDSFTGDPQNNTVGSATIGTAPWSIVLAGNGLHQIDLAHSHTDSGHSHLMQNHTHSVPSHFHRPGTIAISASGSHQHAINDGAGGTARSFGGALAGGLSNTGTAFFLDTDAVTHTHSNTDFTGVVGDSGGQDGDSAFNSGVPSNNNTNSGTANLLNSLSATQSIQPRSVAVRFIMRYK